MRKTEVIKLTVTTSIKIERITQTEDCPKTTKKTDAGRNCIGCGQ